MNSMSTSRRRIVICLFTIARAVQANVCFDRYGRDFTLCRESDNECSFAVLLNGRSCNDFCEKHGGVCISGEGTDGLNCRSTGTNSCFEELTDNICNCSKEKATPLKQQAPTPCTKQYGADNLYVCGESSTECSLSVLLKGDSCDNFCEAHGGVCISAEHTDGHNCKGLGKSPCSDRFTDHICNCSRKKEAVRDGGAIEALKKDTSPTKSPPEPPSYETLCTNQYGTDNLLCGQSSSQCSFAVLLNGNTCNDFCMWHGGTCLSAEQIDGINCNGRYSNSCSASLTDNLCHCSMNNIMPTPCTNKYGTDNLLCGENEMACSLAVELNGDSCDNFCQQHGGVCISAEANEYHTCMSSGPMSCSAKRGDNICKCSMHDIMPTPCTNKYGTDNLLCGESETECSLAVELNGDSCDDFCQQHGGVCISAEANEYHSCESNGPISCSAERGDNICNCSMDNGQPQGQLATMTPCANQYGIDNLLCGENNTECTIGVLLNGDSCDDFCQQHGGVCLSAEATDGYHCRGHGPSRCSEKLTDNICHCSLNNMQTPSPTRPPTPVPTVDPTSSPTRPPTPVPTVDPTPSPTREPTPVPTVDPTPSPTRPPTPLPTVDPTPSPTRPPTPLPTVDPTPIPMLPPTRRPRTEAPTSKATVLPTREPTHSPTPVPTAIPTPQPTRAPTQGPTKNPTAEPTIRSSQKPSKNPTSEPTPISTEAPTLKPTIRPTPRPTVTPTERPSLNPTENPTLSPTHSPTEVPTKSPSSSPTRKPSPSPTSSPTPLPTHLPTGTLTPLPTHLPTETPTTPPTDSPITPAPTASVTAQDSIIPYDKKICKKCDRNGCYSVEEPINESRCIKFDCFSRTNCPNYRAVNAQRNDKTKPPSEPTTNAPTGAPTRSTKRLGTGKVCSTNDDCMSKTCRNGACMATSECYPVKHEYGSPFDKNRINLVFVGSAFETKESWRAQVKETYTLMKGYKMFAENVKQLNVFLVEPEKLDPSFCYYDCGGIERILCCHIVKAQRLANKCMPEGANMQTVVIHNEEQYGGAGYTYQNLATTSRHELSAEVVVHELGHSLFELADEYSYGPGTDEFANCAATSDCSKWADLIERTPNGYEQVSCQAGCNNDKYFVGDASYMNQLGLPVGAVNERYTCCTYLALTKSMPSYCNAFEFEPGYLENFCKFHDYQNYGSYNYEATPKLSISKGLHRDNYSKYIHVSDPWLVSIKIHNGATKTLGKPVPASPGLYRKERVLGDFDKVSQAAANGFESVIQVKVTYVTGSKRLLFSTNTTIEVPSLPGSTKELEGQVPRVSEEAELINVVLDAKGRRIKRVGAKYLTFG